MIIGSNNITSVWYAFLSLTNHFIIKTLQVSGCFNVQGHTQNKAWFFSVLYTLVFYKKKSVKSFRKKFTYFKNSLLV